jgi:predicted DNA-binding transcriptional regulator AlpA
VNKTFLSIQEFCTRFAVSRATAYRLFGAGAIRPRKIGTRTLVAAEEAERWASALPSAAIGGRIRPATRREAGNAGR